jgi:hypothetical protein
MQITAAERKMWLNAPHYSRTKLSDSEINAKYERGEGRIVVENNREKLPGFVEQLKNGEYMDVRPFYQRRPRWDTTRQSRLIESFLINLPVPPVFQYEVMDGQQRISAIMDFFQNRFPLKDLQHWPELNGRYYHNLPKLVKAGIDRRSISSIVMLKESAPEDEEALFLRQIVFERLNTGGVELERQEIRNALFQGSLNNTLMRLSRHPVLRSAWGLPIYHKDELTQRDPQLMESSFFQKMEDVELVLRFLALRNAKQYTRGMQGFLDLYMMKASKLNTEVIEGLEVIFTETIELAGSIYGEKVFRPYIPDRKEWANRPQKAFYDAIMVAISQHLSARDILIKRRGKVVRATAELFDNTAEGAFTGRGNSKADILTRIELASGMLKSVIDE